MCMGNSAGVPWLLTVSSATRSLSCASPVGCAACHRVVNSVSVRLQIRRLPRRLLVDLPDAANRARILKVRTA